VLVPAIFFSFCVKEEGEKKNSRAFFRLLILDDLFTMIFVVRILMNSFERASSNVTNEQQINLKVINFNFKIDKNFVF
jgi:hypothetical protein